MKKKVNVSLFLISFSVFLYQVCLLRILSISDFYHFAFLIVSVALLGFGISGSFLYFFINKISNPRVCYIIFSAGFSVSIILSFLVINLVPFDSFKIAWELKQLFYLFIYYLFLIAPFFFGGCFIGYVFYNLEKPSLTYFFNLIGSAAGALAFLVLLPATGKTGVILLASILGIVSLIILTSKGYAKILVLFSTVFVIVVFLLCIFFPQIWDIRISPYKSLATALRYPDSELAYSSENSSAKIDIVKSENIKSAPGISLKYQDVPPPQLGLTVDADNLSPITKYSKERLDFLDFLPQSLFFGLGRDYENILIVEPGGGLDVLASEYFVGSNIYVVQNNVLITEALKGYFSSYSGDIYNKENITVINDSIRNFSKITDKKFDLIILSLSDSYHPISSGAYSLNENYLYTKESLADLIKIADNKGIVAVTRWVQFPPSENLKILSTFIESIEDAGIKDITDKIFAFRSWSTFTTMFSKTSFSSKEAGTLKQKTGSLNYDLVYYEGMKIEEANKYNKLDEPYFHKYFKKILEGNNQQRLSFYDQYYFNIEPTSDNNPYFYNFFKFRQVPDIVKYFGKSTQPFGGGGYLILIAALVISIILSALLILFPLRVKNIRLRLKGNYPYLIYFLSIGLGFFFIELPFIQKFILILGKPAYSLSVILFSIMLFAGIGSFVTSRYRVNINWTIPILFVYVILFVFTFRHLSSFMLSRVLWQRFLLTVLLVMPAGFLMGMPFPLGIARAKVEKPNIVPWLWAINGCASVIGSIAAVIVSLHLGFLVVIGISGLLYISAMVA
ncbi:MAG: hypothetical protein ACQEP2_07990, partial [Actinomycetota bacterium]